MILSLSLGFSLSLGMSCWCWSRCWSWRWSRCLSRGGTWGCSVWGNGNRRWGIDLGSLDRESIKINQYEIRQNFTLL